MPIDWAPQLYLYFRVSKPWIKAKILTKYFATLTIGLFAHSATLSGDFTKSHSPKPQLATIPDPQY